MPADVYFVTATRNAPAVRSRLKEIAPDGDLYEISPDKWMVAFEGGTRDLAEKAGIRGGDDVLGTGLVLPVTTYSGRAASSLWEWLSSKGA